MKPESLSEFLAWKPPYIQELIGNGILIPQGKIIIFGPYKSWKSMTAIDLAFKLASGKPWLGFKTTLSTVLMVQLEIPKAAYQKRVNKYVFGNKLNPSTNLYFQTIRNLKLDKGWGIQMLDQWITETKAQVVIIDPIFKVISGRLTDEFDVRQFTDRMDETIDKHRVSLILIHHEGKDWIVEGERYDRGADAAFGSAVFGWWCDSSIELRTICPNCGAELMVNVCPKCGIVDNNLVKVSFPLLRLAENDIKPLKVEVNRDSLVFTNKGNLSYD